ncbi:MAG: glutathione peroxidase [Burkholderiales bacterium]|nr:glutathione peroxidase [Burkholderiales bacterium]
MRRVPAILGFALALLCCRPSLAADSCPALLNHTLNPLIGGKPVALCQYARGPVLLVNTASQCGYTYQYAGLEKLWRRYKDRGLTVIGIPANDFGQQEPGSNRQIADFCQVNFGVSFPMFEKLSVPIPKSALYAPIIAHAGTAPRWNFHKYLIDRSGKVTSFDSNVEPESRALTAAIERALAAR